LAIETLRPEDVAIKSVPRIDTATVLTQRGFGCGLLAVGCGLLALAPLPPELRAALLGAFVLTGPGIAVVTHLPLPRPAAIAAVPVIGLTTIAGTTTLLSWFHRFPVTALQVVLVAVVGAAILRRPGGFAARPLPRPPDVRHIAAALTAGRRALIRNPAAILLMGALVGWATILPGLRDVPYSQFGLLFVGTGPAIALCTLLVVAAFVVALRQGRLRTATLAIGVAIVIQRLTVTLITDVPIYGWVYKHIGVIDYIQRFQDLPPDRDIYGQWPSFFTTFAWFDNLTGVDPLVVAHIFAPLVHVLIAVEVAAIARLVGLDLRTALTAAMLAELTNWVGQDYFSPQAVALVTALGIAALLIASRTVPAAGYLSIPLFAVLVPMHQLTPYWLCGVAIVLAVTRRLRPWWLPIPYVVLLVGYLIPRVPIVAPYGIFSGFNPVANAQSNIVFEGNFGKLFTSVICRSLSAGVVLLAVVCAVVWWRQHKPCLIPAVLAFSSFALLCSQNYGGEAIFRVYLFALPGCAILIAPLAVQAISIRNDRALVTRSVLAVTGIALGLATCAGLQGYYGLWSLIVEYRSQVVWGNDLMAREQPPVRILSMYLAGLSTRSTADYVRFAEQNPDFDQTLPGMPAALLQDFPSAGQLNHLTADAAAAAGNTYLVFDRQANLALDYYGYLPPGTIARFQDQVRANPQWALYEANDVTTIYKFHRAPAGRSHSLSGGPAPRLAHQTGWLSECSVVGWFNVSTCGAGG
jgi:hypothetical protein